jgi:hypothetical protein
LPCHGYLLATVLKYCGNSKQARWLTTLRRKNTMSLSDRRRYPRFPFHSRAALLLNDLELNGTLMDISLAGALFAVDQHLDVPSLTECRLAIYHRRRYSAENMYGTVVYCVNHLIGIQFLEIGRTAENELKLMIDMNLASSHLLERDLPALLR